MEIPTEYIIDKIYELARNVKAKDSHQIYNFSCPVCGEGKSKNKRRGFFIVKDNYFYCQNCQKSWSPVNWIMEVEHLTFRQVVKESNEYDNTFNEVLLKQTLTEDRNTKPIKLSSLPHDSINLSDPVQLQYHHNSKEVQFCLKYIKSRRLDSATNRPRNFYISLTDEIHKNRLCIPFYDVTGKIIYYQTRALYDKDAAIAKYFSKKGCEKSLYGINNILSDLEYIFIFEGPIDSMFCQNGVAACGLSLSKLQEEQLDKYRLFEKIWVLDNQLENPDVHKKYTELIDKGANVFFWSRDFKDYKDMNDVCVATGKNHIPTKFILNNTLNRMAAKLKLAELSTC